MKHFRWYVAVVVLVLCNAMPVFARKPLQPLTIQLDWLPNVQFAGILLAQAKGWYEEEGIYLTIRRRGPEISPIEEVLNDRAQIGVEEGAELIKARTQGLPIKAIAAQSQKSSYCLISKIDKNITTPAQLVGQRIGINSPASLLMTKVTLMDQGFDLKDVTIVPIEVDLRDLINDEIDVYPGHMFNAPLLLKEQGYETNVISAFRYGYDFYGGVYFITEKMLQEEPEVIEAFLKVTLRGWEEAFKDIAATAEFIVTRYNPGGSVEQQTESLKRFQILTTIGVGEKLFGLMKEEVWASGVDILYRYQEIESLVPAKDVFTLEFLQKIYLK